MKRHHAILALLLCLLAANAAGCASIDDEFRELEEPDPLDRQDGLLDLMLLETEGELSVEQRERLVEESEIMTQDSSALVRSTALLTLAKLDAERAVTAAREALRADASQYVRMDAARTLGDLAPPEVAIPALGDALDPKRERDEGVRIAVVKSIVNVKAPRAGPALVDALRDPSASVRYHASRGLATITGEDRGADPAAWRDYDFSSPDEQPGDGG